MNAADLARAQAALTPAVATRLEELRGWTPAALERLGVGFDGHRVVIPVYDEVGDLVGCLRYEPDPDRRNGGVPKMLAASGTPRALFPPPETIGDDEIDVVLWLVEGEPDALRLWSLGLPAVGVPGAQNWRDEWAARFAGLRVVVAVIFDCDAAGRRNAVRAATALVQRGVDVRVVDLDPKREDGHDLSDYLAPARTPAERMQAAEMLRAIVADTPPFESLREGATDGDPSVTFAEFVKRRDDTTAEALVSSEQGTLLPAGGLAILAAKTGDGKTTATVEFVQHACAGRDYLGLSFPRALNVLVIENEGPREAFREKLAARLASWKHPGEPRIWDSPAEWGQIRISKPAIRDRLREVVEEHHTDLIVSDSLTRFGVRGNGTPEETREFVEWLSEIGLGRDVAFLLLHHPRTRPEQGEAELERLAGAWPPHADLILLLQRLEPGRARLSFPKARWAHGQRSACILAFDADTESFTYVGEDVPEERDLVAELVELMGDGEWWTKSKLRESKDKGGVGVRPDALDSALADEHFESALGEEIGRRAGSTYYRLKEASPGSGDARNASASAGQAEEASRVTASKRGTSGDASFDPSPSEAEIERLAELAREAQEDEP